MKVKRELHFPDGTETIEEIDAEVIECAKTVPKPTTEERLASLEDAACESDAANDARMTEIENALCELDGGATNG